VSVYPVSVWVKDVQPLLTAAGEQAVAAQVRFIANCFGSDSKIDGKGRIRLGEELRRTLNLDAQSVYIAHHRGHFIVLSEPVYQQWRSDAQRNLQRTLLELELRG